MGSHFSSWADNRRHLTKEKWRTAAAKAEHFYPMRGENTRLPCKFENEGSRDAGSKR